MPPEGKTPWLKTDFPLGNVNLYYQSKKPFISKSFLSRALDPKGSLLYFCKSHFLSHIPWPQKGAGRQLRAWKCRCQGTAGAGTALLFSTRVAADPPGSSSGTPLLPRRAPLPLLLRERGTGGLSPTVSIPQQEPVQQVRSLPPNSFLLRCSKPGALPFQDEAESTAPKWF